MGNLYDVRTVANLVIGSGASAYNAANRLAGLGEDVVIVTENRLAGTSRNTGSDKQTYYKLTLSGADPDSVREMARTLYDGKAVDGDICLAEAANSVRCFMNLVEIGVAFPTSRYGEYVGYKTDHDPAMRATSAGPLTSQSMTEQLEKEAVRKGIEILDKHMVIRVLTDGEGAAGVLCLSSAADEPRFHVLLAGNIIYATGGPAGIYRQVVYPAGRYGMTGAAFAAGAKGRNLTEWQYGLASVRPRWNVSGTYMQVLPRFVSADDGGGDVREFLGDALREPADELNRIFLKGYQWPFDVRKAQDGSSLIDLLVYRETAIRGRHVYLDFRTNPHGADLLDYPVLSDEARTYLERAGAAFGTPVQRLRHMNEPAYQFYLGKGVDLETDLLEIALCAQHNNGGLAVDSCWQTDVPGLYAAGEAAGTHGVNRPGGSALNAGQVGSLRAAQHIHRVKRQAPQLSGTIRRQVDAAIELASACAGVEDTAGEIRQRLCTTFSQIAGPIRDPLKLREHVETLTDLIAHFPERVRVAEAADLGQVYRLYDICLVQLACSTAQLDYVSQGGRSRGSCIYLDPQGGIDQTDLMDGLRYSLDDGGLDEVIQEISLEGREARAEWRQRRPIPGAAEAFETVWRDFRENNAIRENAAIE